MKTFRWGELDTGFEGMRMLGNADENGLNPLKSALRSIRVIRVPSTLPYSPHRNPSTANPARSSTRSTTVAATSSMVSGLE